MNVPRLFDRLTYARKRARARGPGFLADEVGQNLADRLGAVTRRFGQGLDLSSRDQAFAACEPFASRWTRTALSLRGAIDVVADEEALPFPAASFDLIVSALSLHAVNDLPGAMAQIRHVLKPDGLFLAALFGGGTLNELRNAFAAGESNVTGGISPRVSPFAEVRDLGGLLQRAGFALPVADNERSIVYYRQFSTLVDDLRALGETNAMFERAKTPLRRDVLAAMLAHHAAHDADEAGRLKTTFDVIYLTAWAPHESQQKPLKPGSAKMRLADALETREQSAGERAAPKPEDT
jgi:SAM-dependent methyltransferase